MKEIKAIIRPEKQDAVLQALQSIEGLPGVTISRIRGFGKGRFRHAPEKVAEGVFLFVERVKLEVVVDDGLVEPVITGIVSAAQTGNTGDGKIFVSDIAECVKIRTGERGADAV